MQKQLAIKILAIFVVGLLVLIPTTMVEHKVYERHSYHEQAKTTVAQSWTGPQLLTSPILIIPYHLSPTKQSGFISDKATSRLNKSVLMLADELLIVADVANKNVFKGIYQVPVYNSSIKFSGKFSAEKIQHQITLIQQLQGFESLGTPYISIHIADVRGIDKAPSLTINKLPVSLEPGSQLSPFPSGLSAQLPALLKGGEAIGFAVLVSLRGMESLSFVPLADTTNTTIRSDWPHPEFVGATLPSTRDITSSGFSANWSSTRFSSNGPSLLAQCLESTECPALLSTSSGVKFIEPVDVYLQSERSVKYAILFIGLSFITFFIFEHIKRIRIHPIQYAFVGLAISVFYLLLISLAEHMAFGWAYLIAVMCCSGLLLFYVRYMLRNLFSALLYSGMIVGLYGLLYVIVQAEDFALLMGAVLVFLVLTAMMVVTRKIDWYSLAETDNNHSVEEANSELDS